jgi:hypothetical protein
MNRISLSKIQNYSIIKSNDGNETIYPYLIGDYSDDKKEGSVVSSFHGRSVIINEINNNEFIILKGCGLTYTNNNFIDCNEFEDYGHLWGYLDIESANRDFTIGNYCEKIGINTGNYQFILRLNQQISTYNQNGLYPFILQYKIKCPIRLYDLPFVSKKVAYFHLNRVKEETLTYYESFGKILFQQLLILHNHNVFYNGMNTLNISAQCELLDWESSSIDDLPFGNDFDSKCKDLFPRELLNVFNICYFISIFTKEKYDPIKIERLKNEFYVPGITNSFMKNNLLLIHSIR